MSRNWFFEFIEHLETPIIHQNMMGRRFEWFAIVHLCILIRAMPSYVTQGKLATPHVK